MAMPFVFSERKFQDNLFPCAVFSLYGVSLSHEIVELTVGFTKSPISNQSMGFQSVFCCVVLCCVVLCCVVLRFIIQMHKTAKFTKRAETSVVRPFHRIRCLISSFDSKPTLFEKSVINCFLLLTNKRKIEERFNRLC